MSLKRSVIGERSEKFQFAIIFVSGAFSHCNYSEKQLVFRPSDLGVASARIQKTKLCPMKMNVLILHNISDFSKSFRNASEYIMCFQRYAPEHNYLYHDIMQPLTKVLRDAPFHVVIIDSTALAVCRRRPREVWYAEKERWSFLRDVGSVKFAFAQDDYHQTETLDELFFDWKIDHVYPAVPRYHEMLYPRSSQRSHIETALTGYVDDQSIDRCSQFARPYDARETDIAQRVTFYSPHGGRLSQLKGRLALGLQDVAQAAGLSTDISTRYEDRIYGDDWLRFLGNARAVSGAPSGVSVWDPKGEVYDRVYDFRRANPEAGFDEVEAACFAGLDGLYNFATISPRLFEAAQMKCAQILIKANYLDVLEPFEHYIPVSPDLSDLADAVDELRNREACNRRISACFEALILNPRFRASTFVGRVFDDAGDTMRQRHVALPRVDNFQSISSAHVQELEKLQHQELERPRVEPEELRHLSADVLSARTLKDIAFRIAPFVAPYLPRGVKDAAKSMLGRL